MIGMKLLFAEDEIGLSEAVVDILTYHNYQVDAVYDGADALAYARTESYDGMIFDVMMPRLDGFEVLKLLRSEGCRPPILLLTAKTEVEARIQGLNLGADDYLPKPFDMGELLARIRAMLRRREQYQPDVLTYGGLSLAPHSCELRGNGRSVRLSRLEYQLMEALMLNQGIYLSSEDLLVKVWGYETEAELGSVWVYLSYLRKHIKSLGVRVEIRARRGVGYSLEQTP